MGLPRIEPYPMPREIDLPFNTAQWTVEVDRAVLLIHDMQRYFVAPFPQDTSPTVELLDHVGQLRRRCAELDIPVAYTAQPGGMDEEQRGLLRDFWGPGMTVDQAHRRVLEHIAPTEHDHVFTKWRYSAFHRTGLLDFLHERGRDQLIICGVYAHVGVLMTACDAFSHDIQPFLVADAVADFSLDYHRLAVTYAAERCAMTPTTAAVLSALELAEDLRAAS